MKRKAAKYLRQRSLPAVGFVLFFNGSAFAWSRTSPDPSRVIPGVVAFPVDGGGLLVARGGDAVRGAERFESVE